MEFTHFSRYQVNYVRTRLRSQTDYESFLRASCNPDPDHFVLEWLMPFLDEEGFSRPELAGKQAFFITDEHGNYRPFWSREEAIAEYPDEDPINYTFIPSSIADNPKMLEVNPKYIRNLKGSDPALTKALLEGNWFYKPKDSAYFDRSWVEEVTSAPIRAKRVRAWDLAASEPSEVNRDPDWTVGVKMSKDTDGNFYIEGMKRFRKKSGTRDELMLSTAAADGRETLVGIPVDAGASGLYAAKEICKKFVNNGFKTKQVKVSNKSKLTRFEPFSTAAQCGLIRVVVSSFDKADLETFYKELEAFTDDGKGHDDIVDATADAFLMLQQTTVVPKFSISSMKSQNPFKN